MTTDVLKHRLTRTTSQLSPDDAWRFATDHFLLLPIGGLIAIVWANLAAESYFTLALLTRPVVNDIGMTIFFALIAQEILEAVMPGGALHTWRRWAIPVLAAAGATAAAGGLYVAYVTRAHELVLQAGWPVAAAIDLTFVYMLVRSIFGRHPAVAFALLVAVSANVFGVIGIAQTPFAQVRPGAVALLIIALSIAWSMRIWKVRTFWPYLLVCGPMSWWAFYTGGIHPALALVPLVFFLPRAPRSLTLFEDRPHSAHDSPRHLEHALKYPVHVVLFLFGLVNAGVLMTGYGTGTWAILAAALIAKPIGLLAATAAAVALGLHLPRGLHWSDLGVVALATCGGFAFALFYATAAYPLGPLLTELKIGAILSGVGVPITLTAAWVGGVGRFKTRRQPG